MANAFSIIHQNRKIVDPINLDFTNQVLSYKQGKYDKNLANIQNTIDTFTSLPLMKDVDKKYLSDRLNTLVNEVNDASVQDLSRRGVANQINDFIMTAVDDNVKNAFSTSIDMQNKLTEMQELVKKNPELYAQQNFEVFNQQFQDYLGNGVLGEERSFQSYTPYTDYKGQLDEGISKWVKDNGIQNYTEYVTGQDNVLYKVTGERVSKDELDRVFESLTTPQMENQIMMDANYMYRGIDDEVLTSRYNEIRDSRIRDLQKQSNEIRSKMTGATEKEKQSLAISLKQLESGISNLKSTNFDRAQHTTQLFRNDFKDNMLGMYSKDKVTSTEISTDMLDYEKALLDVRKRQKELGEGTGATTGLPQGFQVVTTAGEIDETGEIEGEHAFDIIENKALQAEDNLMQQAYRNLNDKDFKSKFGFDKPKTEDEFKSYVRDNFLSTSDDGSLVIDVDKVPQEFQGLINNYSAEIGAYNEEVELTNEGLQEGIDTMARGIASQIQTGDFRIRENFFSNEENQHMIEYARKLAENPNYDINQDPDLKNAVTVSMIDSLHSGTHLLWDKIDNSIEPQIRALRNKSLNSIKDKSLKETFASTDTVESTFGYNILRGLGNIMKGDLDRRFDVTFSGEPSQEDIDQMKRGREQLSRGFTTISDMLNISVPDISVRDKEGEKVSAAKFINSLVQGKTDKERLRSKVGNLQSRSEILMAPDKDNELVTNIRRNAKSAIQRSNQGLSKEQASAIDKSPLTVSYKDGVYTIGFATAFKNIEPLTFNSREAVRKAGLSEAVQAIDTRGKTWVNNPENPEAKPRVLRHKPITDSATNRARKYQIVGNDGVVRKPDSVVDVKGVLDQTSSINDQGNRVNFNESYPNIYNFLTSGQPLDFKFTPDTASKSYLQTVIVDGKEIDFGLPNLKGLFKPEEYSKIIPFKLGQISENIRILYSTNPNNLTLKNLEESLR